MKENTFEESFKLWIFIIWLGNIWFHKSDAGNAKV